MAHRPSASQPDRPGGRPWLARAATLACAATLLAAATGCKSYSYRVPHSASVVALPVETRGSYQERARQIESGRSADSRPQARPESEQISTRVYAAQQTDRSGLQAVGRALGKLTAQANTGGGTTPPPATVPITDQGKATGEMLDIEAHVTVQVARVADALPKLRELVGAHGARVINDVTTDRSSSSGAALSIRVPVDKTEAFLASLASLGRISSRRVTARDIGKEFHDAQLLLKNLEAALARYQEILAKAQTAAEILEIELAMSEVRTRIDRVKGDIVWMRDHAERSTVYVTLEAQGPDDVPAEPKFYPGLRATALLDISSTGKLSGMAGAGLAVQLGRVFNASMDLLREPGASGGGLDAFVLTLGSEFYSDLLGGGRRRTLNPYLGLRAGYARFRARSEIAAGGSLGVELYKSKSVLLDLGAHALALFGTSRGSHVAIVPSLGLSVAFLPGPLRHALAPGGSARSRMRRRWQRVRSIPAQRARWLPQRAAGGAGGWRRRRRGSCTWAARRRFWSRGWTRARAAARWCCAARTSTGRGWWPGPRGASSTT